MKKVTAVKLFYMAILGILLAGCEVPKEEMGQGYADSGSPEITVPIEQEKAVLPTQILLPTEVPTKTQAPSPTATVIPIEAPTAIPTATPTPIDTEQALLNGFADTGDSELNSMCDEILVEILNIDMTEREQAYAIYQWVNQNVKYRGISDTSDWIEGAKYALTYKKGNCYAFYAASRGLLTRAGFENVEATEYEFTHYWNIVKVDGVWRHFDTTTGWGTERFLWTGTQILEYSYYSEGYGRDIIYEWNPEGCPNTD